MSEEEYPKSMEEYDDKWWLTKRHLSELNEFNSTGYTVIINNHGNNIYDDSNVEIKHFKNITDAYEYTCDYLAQMYNDFGGDNLSLYNAEGSYRKFPEYNDALSDWHIIYENFTIITIQNNRPRSYCKINTL